MTMSKNGKHLSLQVNNNLVEFKLDTGAQANVILSDVFNSLKGIPQLKTTKANLTGFNGSEILVVRVARMICKYKDKQIDSDFFVVEADRPWQKIACDLFTLGGKDYLLTVDYYSKWVEIGFLRDSTVSSEVITQLKSTLARYGIPDEVISDTGPQFSSRKFKQFAESWEFKHTTASPKHPQANGQVEKTIGTTKSVLKKAYEDGSDPYIALLESRNTPMTGLSYSLAQVLLNRRLKTRLPTTTQLLDARIPTDASAPCSTENTEAVF